jgi:transposase
MLGKKKFEPKLMYNLTIDDLVPEDDFYRRLDKLLDLRFVYQECKNLYGKTGNPSIDPVVFFKLNLFGFFENITSDREIIRKASDRLSVRYYLGYDIDEKLPWHSTISRTRVLIKKETFELVFNKILEKCYKAGLIEGRHQSIDSTLVKANASLDSIERKVPKLSVKEYMDKAYTENPEEEKEENDKDKPEGGLKLEKTDSRKSTSNEKDKNKKYFSRTDPDSRITSKPGKATGLYYSTHYSADSKNRIITDVLTTYADRRDSKVFMEVYERVEKRLKQLGLSIEEVSADKGYCSGENLRKLERGGIKAFVPTQRVKHPVVIANRQFIYNEEKDSVVCPNNKQLEYYSYDKKYQRKRYKARKEDCQGCPIKEKCCPSAKSRSVSRTIYYQEYERLENRLKTPRARQAYIIRKTVSEGLFAEAKTNHTLQKFMTRGIDNAQKKSYLIASVQNLKRLIKTLRKEPKPVIQISRVDSGRSLWENKLIRISSLLKLRLCTTN